MFRLDFETIYRNWKIIPKLSKIILKSNFEFFKAHTGFFKVYLWCKKRKNKNWKAIIYSISCSFVLNKVSIRDGSKNTYLKKFEHFFPTSNFISHNQLPCKKKKEKKEEFMLQSCFDLFENKTPIR